MTSRIKALDIDVVNKIAAGEIIVAPENALKELLENAIDAKSTSIDIIIQDGGLKLLQMTDNGVGIYKEDLPILCERFTTSKLSTFEDLNSIGTYGFRGEALASISHISRLTVTTKTKDSACAYRAIYQEGRMVGEPKPVAGKDGTQILIEDLFYNVPSRLRSLKGGNEQLSKILDVVARYAINTDGVAFSVKKAGDTLNLLAVRANNSTKDKVRTVFGSAVASELLPIAVEKSEEIGLLSCEGQITNTSYYSKKSVSPIFFINGRLVSCDPLKRMITQLYSSFLPKGHKPFVYLRIDIKRENLDVNVHPTKREVRFLFEDEIFQVIFQSIQAKLGSLDHSRKFVTTQSVLKHQYAPQEEITKKPQTLLRTDDLQSKITAFINTTNTESFGTIVKDRVTVKLSSILELRQQLENKVSEDLTNMFAKHTYVGLVDPNRRLCCIQYDVKLFLVDYASISYELIYQIGLSDFNNFGTLYLESEKPITIRELLEIVYESIDTSVPPIDDVLEALFEMKDMLLEYFSIELQGTEKDPILRSLPIVIKGYTPSIGKLPLFWYRLGTKVDWSSEKECLDGILRQIALLYVPEVSEAEGIEKILEDLIFPTIKSRLLAVDSLSKSVVEIANLPGLYKVFERC